MEIAGLGPMERDDQDDAHGWYYSPPTKIAVLGDEKRCLILQGYDDDEKPEDFQAAITSFLSIGAEVLDAAAPFVFAYYQDCAADGAPPLPIDKPADIWRHVRFGAEIYVRRRDNAVYVSVECACDWEPEHGLQVVFKNGRTVNKVGAFDSHLTNAAAYAEPSYEDVVYVDRATLRLRIAARRKPKKR